MQPIQFIYGNTYNYNISVVEGTLKIIVKTIGMERIEYHAKSTDPKIVTFFNAFNVCVPFVNDETFVSGNNAIKFPDLPNRNVVMYLKCDNIGPNDYAHTYTLRFKPVIVSKRTLMERKINDLTKSVHELMVSKLELEGRIKELEEKKVNN